MTSANTQPFNEIRIQAAAPGCYPRLWDEAELFALPEAIAADRLVTDIPHASNVRPVLLDGIPYEGRPTRFFAWVGLPPGASADNRVPGVVLVHGGGGSAFVQWVEEWTNRGYAAIAMATAGTRPITRFECVKAYEPLPGDRPGHLNFQRDVENPHDSWTTHAVGTIARSRSYLASLPEVDGNRIGLTGISWGGYLTEIAAAVIPGFVAAVPVYGCGFLGEFQATVPKATREWLMLFDPVRFLPSARYPLFFAALPTDENYFWSQWVRSTLLPQQLVMRSCRIGLDHSHEAGRVPEAEIFLDAYCLGKPNLPILEEAVSCGHRLSASFLAQAPVREAFVAWNEDSFAVPPPQRQWRQSPAEIHGNCITAILPEKATQYYLGLCDARGGIVTTAGKGWDLTP